jgi:hypothetical protein
MCLASFSLVRRWTASRTPVSIGSCCFAILRQLALHMTRSTAHHYTLDNTEHLHDLVIDLTQTLYIKASCKNNVIIIIKKQSANYLCQLAKRVLNTRLQKQSKSDQTHPLPSPGSHGRSSNHSFPTTGSRAVDPRHGQKTKQARDRRM